ncbi:MAG TPA: alpha/beta hydrolase [Bacteroidota bacterium]|nr:alpha/beta hydrolase [Bacteroidota bacterium]
MKIRISFRKTLLLFILGMCFTAGVSCGTKPSTDTSIAQGEFTAQINGLKLWYKVSGKGPVCILPTPGWGPSGELYFLKLTPLEEMFTMVYLDTRGCGRSERPDLHAYSMRDLVSDLEGLREHLGVDSMWLLGHSDGGPMILNYACAHRVRVKGLILVDAPAGTPGEGAERMRRLQMRKGEPWFEKTWKEFQTPPTTQIEFESYIRSILPFFFSSQVNLEKNLDVFEKTTLSFEAQCGRGLSDQSTADLASNLPTMKIPTLILAGDEDFICPPSSAEALHDLIPNSSLVEIKQAGHFPWLEKPEEFFQSIETFVQAGVKAKN